MTPAILFTTVLSENNYVFVQWGASEPEKTAAIFWTFSIFEMQAKI